MPPGRPGHLRSFDYLGFHRYFLTFCTYFRCRLFTTDAAVSLTLSQFLRAAREEAFDIIVYCFMPDHVHLLVEGTSEISDGRRFFKLAKQYSGYYHTREFRQPLWQRDGYEHVLRSDEATLAVAKYILENPVRAQLVGDAFEYPFSGSCRYSKEELRDLIAQEANCWMPDEKPRRPA